jgi:hypothetical protein
VVEGGHLARPGVGAIVVDGTPVGPGVGAWVVHLPGVGACVVEGRQTA